MQIFYTHPFNPTGINGRNVHVRQFIQNMEELGHTIITTNGRPEKNDFGYPKSYIDKLIFLRNVDVIYERIEFRSPIGGWYKRTQRTLLKNPIIAWEFNAIPEFGDIVGRSKLQIEAEKNNFRSLSKYCDIAFCVSNRIKEYVVEELGVCNVVTVPNGSDLTMFSPDHPPVPRLSYEKDEIKVIWIGSAGLEWHDFDFIRRTAAALYFEHKISDITFHIVGTGFKDAAKMSPNVHYHGAVQYDEVPYWLSGCEVGLIAYKPGPAEYSSPLKLFDYLASGLLVVSTEQPQVREILTELGSSEYIVKSNDYLSMVKMLLKLRENKHEIKRIGNAGRDLVKEKYTWRQNALLIQNELQSLNGVR
jgi:glycosyltransferase involved in cell wall biosynthesis